MLGWVKRAVAVLVLAPVLVASGAGAASAGLTDPYPAPNLDMARLRAPSSLFSTLRDSSAVQRVAAVRTSLPGFRLPVAGPQDIVKGVGVGSRVSLYTMAFVAGFEGANQIMRWMPDSVVPEEDIGLGALFGVTPDSPGWVPNSEFAAAVTPPGWSGAPKLRMEYNTMYSLDAEVSASQGGEPATSVTVTHRANPWAEDSPQRGLESATGAGVFCRNAGGTVSQEAGSWAYMTLGVVVRTTDCVAVHGAGSVVDHVMFYGGEFGTLNNVDYGTPWSVEAYWYPVGDSRRPVDVDTDPSRVWRTDWWCSDAPEVKKSAVSEAFHETDATFPSFAPAECGAAHVVKMEMWEHTVDDSAPDVLMAQWEPTPEVSAWQGAYPECADGHCTLELGRVDPASGAVLDCFANPSACTGWWTDPDRETKYRCTYGGKVQPTSECAAYSVTFNVMTNTEIPDNDGPIDPSTVDPYGDPATGDPVPGNGSGPGTGGGGTDPQSCMPPFELSLGGIGYWLVKGIVCAIPAMFIPNGQLLGSQLTETVGVVNARPPFTVVSTVTPVLTSLGQGWDGGTCSHALADFTPVGMAPVGSLAVPCQPPEVPGFSALYGLAVLALVVGTAFMVWHMLVAAMGGKSGEES